MRKEEYPAIKSKGKGMRKILYKKMTSFKNRRKTISVSEWAEDAECKTHVRKNFLYVLESDPTAEEEIRQPEVYIKKSVNSQAKEEKFSFRVKGFFFLNQDRYLIKVNFHHSLYILIQWKTKIVSSKSVTLT